VKIVVTGKELVTTYGVDGKVTSTPQEKASKKIEPVLASNLLIFLI